MQLSIPFNHNPTTIHLQHYWKCDGYALDGTINKSTTNTTLTNTTRSTQNLENGHRYPTIAPRNSARLLRLLRMKVALPELLHTNSCQIQIPMFLMSHKLHTTKFPSLHFSCMHFHNNYNRYPGSRHRGDADSSKLRITARLFENLLSRHSLEIPSRSATRAAPPNL